MQAGHASVTTTTSQVAGPAGGASRVTLFSQGQNFYPAAAADTGTTDNRSGFCLFTADAGTRVSLRTGEGESIFAAGYGETVNIDYIVFPE